MIGLVKRDYPCGNPVRITPTGAEVGELLNTGCEVQPAVKSACTRTGVISYCVEMCSRSLLLMEQTENAQAGYNLVN